jgi:hypothetical protein
MACINTAMLNEFDALVVNMSNVRPAAAVVDERESGRRMHLTDCSSTPILVSGVAVRRRSTPDGHKDQ